MNSRVPPIPIKQWPAEMPRTPSGKVQKFVLRQQLREGTLG